MIIALQTLIFYRHSLLTALDRFLRPYYKKFTLAFNRHDNDSDDEESDEQVFAEYDDEKGVVFYPPVYAQRYAAVSDCLMDERWCGKLQKVVDLGYHDMSFIKYLKEVPGIQCILGVDIESIPLRCSSELLGCGEYAAKRENPLQVTLFHGNAADPDYRLIGCDAVVAIEMIEHMLPQDLDRLVHTVFGFIKPWIVIFTTPNGDFNTLFKSMEKNGLRRLDHFFEWTRGQFHDWCSNIVVRYPNFTVTCKGIGPGPAGTLHYGCCSQLALFVSKDYHKQQDLNLNSLALVANVPSPQNIMDFMGEWENPESITENVIGPPNNAESLTEFLYSNKQSCVTIVITSPSFSIDTLRYHDKTSQCNMETERGRNFLMFDDEDMCFSILVPRRTVDHKVYEIEDVNSRLNCTTFQVTKFSKISQNLMAMNKTDSLGHTREVVNEIRNLTRMLNFNKNSPAQNDNGTHTWCNINWGQNAPYWNQYYKVVKDYKYPLETKSEECRIVDLISDEVNRLIDSQCDEEFSVDVNRLEIPIYHLMNVVCHITDDVDKVKDILEWNGYEIVDDVVIHSRLVVDNTSVASNEDEWVENDTISDWDTDVRSTTISDGSTIVPDYHGRCLRRALDKKVRKVRTMLSADEDVTTELDRVVCRLMKLALSSSKGKQTPPPARWMQCKLLDLLTLTEKAIQTRKRHFIDSFPLKAIDFGQEECEDIALNKLKRDDVIALEIVEKYKHFIQVPETQENNLSIDFGLSDEIIDEDDVTSNELLKEFESDDTRGSPQLMPTESMLKDAPSIPKPLPNNESNIGRTQAWVEEDANLALEPYPGNANKSGIVSSSDHTSNGARCRYYKKPCKKNNVYSKHSEILDKKSSRISRNKLNKSEDKHPKTKQECKISKTNLMTKTENKNGPKFVKGYGKNIVTSEYGWSGFKSKSKIREHKKIQPTASKPIPGSLIELCHPELSLQKDIEYMGYTLNETPDININPLADNMAATEESFLVDIVMDDMEETIALRRSIGIDADMPDTILGAVANIAKDVSFHNKLETTTETHVHSQTIFLNDINEPSTSKGVRHVSMDAQCGPDPAINKGPYSKLSSPLSPTRMPKIFTAGIKIGNSFTDIADKKHHISFGTSTNNNTENFQPICPRSTMSNIFRAGIKIGDSSYNIIEDKDKDDFDISAVANVKNFAPVCHRIKSPKVFSAGLKINDSLEHVTIRTQSFDFGTSTNEVIFSSLSPRIKSSCEVQTKDSSDFGTSMFNDYQTKINSSQIFTGIISSVSSGTKSPKVRHMIEISDSFTKVQMKKNCEFGTCTDDYNESHMSPRLKWPKVAARINIDDSLTDVKISKTSRFATSTDSKKTQYRTLTPRIKPAGIRIKDSDKVEFIATKRVAVVSDIQTPYLFNVTSETETQLLKPISSGMRIEDSGSEFYGSCGSPLHFMNPLTNISDFQIKHSVCQNVGVEEYSSTNRIRRRKLSCGGVHVHSYKEKQCSEDVVYQGHWQRHRIKSHVKKKVYHPAIVKKVVSAIPNAIENFKEKKPSCPSKPVQRKVEVKSKQIKTQIRYPKPLEAKHDNIHKIDSDKKKIVLPCCLTKATRSNKSVGKIASKMGTSYNSSKGARGSHVLKKPVLLLPPAVLVNKDGDKLAKYTKNSYVPPYLKKRKNVTNANNLNQSLIPVKTVIKVNKDKPKKVHASPTLILEEVKSSLTKFLDQPLENLQYLVFRNEIENNNKTSTDCEPTGSTKDNAKRKNRCSSPVSQTSSACSTPDSIATVRELSIRSKAFTKRHSTSSNKSSLGNTDTETISPTKNRKYTKRSKIIKKSDDKVHDNKENVPESSKKYVSDTDSSKNDKIAFKKRSKSVFIAQFAAENSPTVNNICKHKTQIPNKSNIKMPVVKIIDEKKRPGTATISSKKITMKSNESLKNEQDNTIFGLEQREPDKTVGHENVITSRTTTENDPEVTKSLDNCVLIEWLGSSGSAMKSTESTILAAMRQIVEDRLKFIDDSAISYETFDFDIFNSGCKNDDQDLISGSSLTSFNTLIKNDISLESCTENGLNRSFDTTLGDESIISLGDRTPTATDTDLLSFKSITSASKFSDYFSADNSQELPSASFHAPKVSSVRDIFERKDHPRIQTPTGALAFHAFSSFSVNTEPMLSDQPDYVNLIDSETGSLALEMARQATSEELFVSGQSSASYESCALDEDMVVPNWLFNIISHQHSLVADEEGELPQILVPMPMPHAEPLFDVNGNVSELGIGFGAGAGDGRGMHSDHSQDSSGRGTSLSSSDTSSGQRSEGILMDPSTFTGQYELMREPVDSSLAVTTLVTSGEAPAVTVRTAGGERNEANAAGTSREVAGRLAPSLLFTSDVDADVSSLDTDIPDSSDN